MSKTQRLATTFLVTLVFLPFRIWGQERPVIIELSAEVGSAAPVELATKTVTVPIPIQGTARPQIEASMAPSSKTRLALTVEGINYDKVPGVNYEVYVGLPMGMQPSHKSVYFVGNLTSFDFGLAGSQLHTSAAEQTRMAIFDITRTVCALKSFKSWSDSTLSVTFVMRGTVDREGRQLPTPPGSRMRLSNMKLVAITP